MNTRLKAMITSTLTITITQQYAQLGYSYKMPFPQEQLANSIRDGLRLTLYNTESKEVTVL